MTDNNPQKDKMKALVLEGINQFSLKDVPIPEISDDDILIKVDSCSICGSDLRIISKGNKRIKYPQIIGHEIAGTIVRVGNNQKSKFNVNNKVSLSADIPCGTCEWCKSGISNNCIDNIAFGYEYQGGFAEYLKLDKRIIDFGPLVVLPETDVTQDELSLCEPLACCVNGIEQCNMVEGEKVLIFGAGPIGCMLVKLANAMGASSVVLCDISQERLGVSKICNANEYVLSSKEALDKVHKEVTNNQGFDIIITACPSIEAQEMSLDYIKNKGFINFFGGLPLDSRKFSIDSNIIHYKNIVILGSNGSTPKHHKTAVDMVLNKKIILKDLISKTFSLDKAKEAIDEAQNNKNNLKVVINP